MTIGTYRWSYVHGNGSMLRGHPEIQLMNHMAVRFLIFHTIFHSSCTFHICPSTMLRRFYFSTSLPTLAVFFPSSFLLSFLPPSFLSFSFLPPPSSSLSPFFLSPFSIFLLSSIPSLLSVIAILMDVKCSHCGFDLHFPSD